MEEELQSRICLLFLTDSTEQMLQEIQHLEEVELDCRSCEKLLRIMEEKFGQTANLVQEQVCFLSLENIRR